MPQMECRVDWRGHPLAPLRWDDGARDEVDGVKDAVHISRGGRLVVHVVRGRHEFVRPLLEALGEARPQLRSLGSDDAHAGVAGKLLAVAVEEGVRRIRVGGGLVREKLVEDSVEFKSVIGTRWRDGLQ